MVEDDDKKSAIHLGCGCFMEKHTTHDGKRYWKCPECETLVQNGDSIKYV